MPHITFSRYGGRPSRPIASGATESRQNTLQVESQNDKHDDFSAHKTIQYYCNEEMQTYLKLQVSLTILLLQFVK